MSTYRILFEKKGLLTFVSHLDFSHSVIRALKRAGLPLKYSEGFSPHPKIVFALPLSVGMVGENELVDVTLTIDEITNEEFKERFSKVLPKDMIIKEVYTPDIKLGKIKSSVYTLILPGCSDKCDKIKEVLKNPPSVEKTTKSGNVKELSIKDLLYSYDAKASGQDTVLTLELASSGDNYLNPEFVIASLNKEGLEISDNFSITRNKLIFS